jgi:enterochelin esterase-like enzyme
LIAFLLAWKHPEAFSKAACISPAFFEKVRGEVESDTLPDRDIRIYIDNGSVGLEARLQPGCDRMMEILQKKGFVMHKNLEWFHDLNAEHNERAWAGRVWRPLMFMFGK